MRSRLDMAENKILSLEKQVSDCKDRIVDGVSRSMKDNLVFHGLKEVKGENTRVILTKFLAENMKIPLAHFKARDFLDCSDEDTIWIHRCHRIGQPGSRNRPIVAKMNTGRECIFKYTRHLAGTPYFVSVQMPPELTENKKKLEFVYLPAGKYCVYPRMVYRQAMA